LGTLDDSYNRYPKSRKIGDIATNKRNMERGKSFSARPKTDRGGNSSWKITIPFFLNIARKSKTHPTNGINHHIFGRVIVCVFSHSKDSSSVFFECPQHSNSFFMLKDSKYYFGKF